MKKVTDEYIRLRTNGSIVNKVYIATIPTENYWVILHAGLSKRTMETKSGWLSKHATGKFRFIITLILELDECE
jgi:hypothetical protein